MEFLLREGDYIPDGQGGLRTAEGSQAVLQRVLFRLQARRGSFPFLPELGSRLWLLPRERPAMRGALAERYVQEALEPETEVTVREVRLEPMKENRMELTALLDWRGQVLTANVTI